MIRSGKSTGSNSAEQRQNRSLEPGVVIFAEIAFATILLYMANQPLDITKLAIADHETNDQEVIADQRLAAITPTIELVSETTTQKSTTMSVFDTAAGVAVAASDINPTDALADALISN